VNQFAGETLRIAVIRNQLDIVKLLVEDGCSIIGDSHKTYAEQAREKGHIEIAKFLEEKSRKDIEYINQQARFRQNGVLLMNSLFRDYNGLPKKTIYEVFLKPVIAFGTRPK
jgi:hypothetical protein